MGRKMGLWKLIERNGRRSRLPALILGSRRRTGRNLDGVDDRFSPGDAARPAEPGVEAVDGFDEHHREAAGDDGHAKLSRPVNGRVVDASRSPGPVHPDPSDTTLMGVLNDAKS